MALSRIAFTSSMDVAAASARLASSKISRVGCRRNAPAPLNRWFSCATLPRALPPRVVAPGDADTFCRQLGHDRTVRTGEDAAAGAAADLVEIAPFGERQDLIVVAGRACGTVFWAWPQYPERAARVARALGFRIAQGIGRLDPLWPT